MKTQLGICADGRALSYDAALYEFALGSEPAALAEVRALDARAKVNWRAGELRDWFARIDGADLAACHERALAERNAVDYDKLTPEQRVQADAAHDDSVLAGKIVDADPALVHAVANQLIEQGLLNEAMRASAAGGAATGGVAASGAAAGDGEGEDGEGGEDFNPLAVMDLPRGMEPLSQLERAKGANRKMTRSEERLMRKILKNDDKAKEKRERRAAPAREPEAGQGQGE